MGCFSVEYPLGHALEAKAHVRYLTVLSTTPFSLRLQAAQNGSSPFNVQWRGGILELSVYSNKPCVYAANPRRLLQLFNSQLTSASRQIR